MRQRWISPAGPATSHSSSRPRAAASSASTSRREWSGSPRSSPSVSAIDVSFVTGDMMALPIPDATFDVVTTGYGLRNVPGFAGALAEIHRVLRPGGLLLSLDFDKPTESCRPRRVSRLPDRGRLDSRDGPSWRPGHLSLHSGVDSTLSRRGRRLCARQNGWVRQVHPSTGARRFPRDALGRPSNAPGFSPKSVTIDG